MRLKLQRKDQRISKMNLNPDITDIINYLSLYISYIFLVAFIFRLLKIDFYNPIVKVWVKSIEPISNTVLFFLPKLIASIVFALLIRCLGLYIISIEAGAENAYMEIFVFSLINTIDFVVKFLLYSILISVILSWVSPYNKNPIFSLANNISDAFLQPFRKLIPPTGGLDFSPMIGILVLYLIDNVIIYEIRNYL